MEFLAQQFATRLGAQRYAQFVAVLREATANDADSDTTVSSLRTVTGGQAELEQLLALLKPALDTGAFEMSAFDAQLRSTAAAASSSSMPMTSMAMSASSAGDIAEETLRGSAQPLYSLFVSDIGHATDQDLRTAFEAYGAVDHASIARDQQQQPRGYGFVHLLSPDAKIKAIEDGSAGRVQVCGRPARVSRCDAKTTLFIGNMPLDATLPEAREFFESVGGALLRIDWKFHSEGKRRTYCFVEYSCNDTANRARQALTGKMMHGRELTVAWSDIKKGDDVQAMRTIHVSQIPHTLCDDARLRTIFSKYGEIVRVQVVTDAATQRPKGYCFVEFRESESATNAIDCENGQQYDGRFIAVNRAQPSKRVVPSKDAAAAAAAQQQNAMMGFGFVPQQAAQQQHGQSGQSAQQQQQQYDALMQQQLQQQQQMMMAMMMQQAAAQQNPQAMQQYMAQMQQMYGAPSSAAAYSGYGSVATAAAAPAAATGAVQRRPAAGAAGQAQSYGAAQQTQFRNQRYQPY